MRMAKQTTVSLVDDLDGTAAQRTISYSWEGASYEIDLSKKNAAALEKAIAPYLAASRKAGRGASRTRRGKSAGTPREQVQAIREWARTNGYQVSDRGRIPAAIQDAYHAAG